MSDFNKILYVLISNKSFLMQGSGFGRKILGGESVEIACCVFYKFLPVVFSSLLMLSANEVSGKRVQIIEKSRFVDRETKLCYLLTPLLSRLDTSQSRYRTLERSGFLGFL